MEIQDDDGQLAEMLVFAKEQGLNPEWAVMFVQEDGYVVHVVFYEQCPNVSSVLDNIEEMKTDEDFGIGEEALNVCSLVIIPLI